MIGYPLGPMGGGLEPAVPGGARIGNPFGPMRGGARAPGPGGRGGT